MITVCAWCEKYLGSKEPLEDPGITHGICPACIERQTLDEVPVLVVSPERAGTIPALNALLGGTPDISIVVDRRSGERRNGRGNGNGQPEPLADERRCEDRRRGPGLYLV
jgi:hypothetical protein